MHVDRFKTFRTFRDDGILVTGEGTPQEQRAVVYRTVVEFIIQLETPITNTDDELDPTQAAELLIVRNFPTHSHPAQPVSILSRIHLHTDGTRLTSVQALAAEC